MNESKPVLGFRCLLKSPRLRRIVRRVLSQIRKRRPDDYRRLQRMVLSFKVLSQYEVEKGTIGQALSVRPPEVDNLAQLWLQATDEEEEARLSRLQSKRGWPKHMLLWDGPFGSAVTDPWLRALVAHELGHAVTTDEDMGKRSGIDSEWASEGCAEYYAYRWGFGRDCAAARKTRSLGHHGPKPGQVVVMYGRRFRMTRSFYLREVT